MTIEPTETWLCRGAVPLTVEMRVYVHRWSIGEHHGARLVIEHDGRAWSCGLASMGSELEPFLASCDTQYLARKMAGDRREEEIDLDAVANLVGVEPGNLALGDVGSYSKALSIALGPDWAMDLPQRETSEFKRARIAAAILIDHCKHLDT